MGILLPQEVYRRTRTVETDFSVPAIGTVQIASANPNRIAIVFSLRGVQNAYISTQQNQATNVGVQLSQTTNALAFPMSEYAGLPCAAWYLSQGTGGVVRVLEVIYWPTEEGVS